ncbi:uncharacterized protein GIQ15_05246 [Arthroderma uncinatum]|uniref:uncharacterized protein n=1 Tax=Arthroderma uncinatum TaxID=74035 RepID=UPI00144A8A47|nr:uncharacterized protein GIQ15_05246 [Arthroderma uncinatum]KAF3482487.1 hypothetical protein GIQ15_05246 [Arthroderma uncinatum]
MSSAVNELADNVASVTISDANGAPAATTADPSAISADEGRRLYIGNLAYATTEGELKDFFQGFSVESTSIPVNPRTDRPVGYAFVDLATAQEAQDAIAALTGKEILERKVSVQLARKPEEQKEAGASGAEGTSGTEGRKRNSNRGRGRGRGRARGGRVGRGGRKTEEGHTEGETTEQAGLTETTNVEEGDAQDKGRRPRGRRGPPEDGIPSKTKVMVANLPYDLTEEGLKELFAAYEPTSSKIALRPIPHFMVKKLQARGEARKGRGFGFVTLGSEALQEKAVQEMHGKDVNGREIAVKVAIDSPGKEDELLDGQAEGQTEAPAAEAEPEAAAAATATA